MKCQNGKKGDLEDHRSQDVCGDLVRRKAGSTDASLLGVKK